MTQSQPPVVLVIEDDLDTCANLGDILELDGYKVQTATTGACALSSTKLPEASVILLDRRLPDATAEDLLPRLRERAPETDVIIVTGHADLDSALAALRLGASDYLLKPVNADALRASVRRLIEKRQAVEELRIQREFAQTIIETAQAIILVLDPQGRIVRFNPFLEELSGRRLEDVEGRDWFETFLPERDRPRIRRLFARAVAGEEVRANVNPILDRDGGEHQIAWWARPLKDSHGRVVGVLSAGHDVTELKETHERLLQSERLAAIGQMIAGLAHESRNALQRAQACLDMLELDLEGRADLLDLTRRTRAALDELHRLYQEVRNYAAPLKLEYREYDLAELWSSTWENLHAQRAGRDVRLVERVEGTSLFCRIDARRIEQVLRNIFENSLAACADPVEIAVECADTDIGGRAAVRISVRDNGPGLTPEQQNRLFDPFFTTRTKGTGLGMAIAKRIVEAHAGTIEVGEAPPDGGTEIVMILPREPP